MGLNSLAHRGYWLHNTTFTALLPFPTSLPHLPRNVPQDHSLINNLHSNPCLHFASRGTQDMTLSKHHAVHLQFCILGPFSPSRMYLSGISTFIKVTHPSRLKARLTATNTLKTFTRKNSTQLQKCVPFNSTLQHIPCENVYMYIYFDYNPGTKL